MHSLTGVLITYTFIPVMCLAPNFSRNEQNLKIRRLTVALSGCGQTGENSALSSRCLVLDWVKSMNYIWPAVPHSNLYIALIILPVCVQVNPNILTDYYFHWVILAEAWPISLHSKGLKAKLLKTFIQIQLIDVSVMPFRGHLLMFLWHLQEDSVIFLRITLPAE